MEQEKLRIIKMVEDKKLTALEAAKLIDALEGESSPAGGVPPSSGARWGRSLRLKVSDLESGRGKVNLCIPVGIAHVLKSLIPPHEMERLEKQGFNLNVLLETITTDTMGKIFEADDGDRNVHVEISIE